MAESGRTEEQKATERVYETVKSKTMENRKNDDEDRKL